MNTHFKYSLLALSMALAGCGGSSSDGSTGNTNTGGNNGGGDNGGGDLIVDTSFCESEAAEGLFFCDDFSKDTFDTNWVKVGDHDGKFVVEDDILWFENGQAGGQLLKATSAVADLIPASGNYYVEARMRLRNNNSTSSKRTYLLGRYNDSAVAYAAGFNSQTSQESRRLSLGYTSGNGVAEHTQVVTPFDMGSKHSYNGDNYTVTEHSTDGTWYNVRLVMNGSTVTMFFDGVEIGSYDGTDPEAGMTNLTDPGTVGFYSNNRAFEVDYVIIGDADQLPASISLDVESEWAPTIDDELTVTVSAVQDGGDPDTVVVANTDSSVVDVHEGADNTFTLKALTAGTAEVSFALASDASKVATLSVTVNEPVVLPTTDYGDISASVTPTVNAQNQQTDVTLSLTLDGDLTLGERGVVYIYDANTDTVVQELNVGGDVTNVGVASVKQRELNYFPVVLDGNTVNIYPKNDAFTAGGAYYIAMTPDVVNGATLNGQEFVGLGEKQWTFQIGAAVDSDKTDLNVGPKGDFATLQGALNYFMEDAALKNAEKTITLEDGVYYEMLMLRNVNNITIKGTSREGTIIRHDNHEARNPGSSGRPLMLVESVDMLTFENITMENSHIRTGNSDQAEVIYFNADGKRLVAKNATFLSEQDTLNLKGYNWFYNTLVAGNVDFIWGYSAASLFENSEIRTIADSKDGTAESDGGYVLQARNPEGSVGFVFLNSKFTQGEGVLGNTVKAGSTYIARSGGSSSYFDNVTLINCELGSHFSSVGWAVPSEKSSFPAPNPGIATASAGWRLDASTLSNSPITAMASEAYTLASGEETPYASREAVFAGFGDDTSWLTVE